MARTDPRTDPQLKLRLPADMKANLAEIAELYARPLSAEIIRRLEWTLNPASGYEEGVELSRNSERAHDVANALGAIGTLKQAIDDLYNKLEKLTARVAAIE